jgi:PBSX family phage terminase large subunit
VKKTIELYPLQHDFFTCENNFTGFIGGVGSGKTFVGSLKAIQKAVPKTLGMICAPSYKMLKDSTLRTFHDLAGDAEANFQKGDMISIMNGGGEILWRSADDPESLRGPNLHWAWIDEGGLTHPDTWKIIIGRLRASGGFGECWTTSTPKGKRNWLYEQSKNMTVFKATTLDNPFVSQEWKDSLLETYTGQFLAQEVYADFVSFEGLIYDFDASIHIKRRNESEFKGYGFGVDEGYTNPTVILKIYYDNDGRYHVADEYYERGKLQSEIVDKATEMGRGKEFVVDASAAGLIAAMRDAGLNARARKGRVLDGISAVQDLLRVRGDGRPRLTIDPSCVNTINEFESYVWKEGKDEPVKEFDHAMDALRYYVHKTGVTINTKASVSNYIGSHKKESRPGF